MFKTSPQTTAEGLNAATHIKTTNAFSRTRTGASVVLAAAAVAFLVNALWGDGLTGLNATVVTTALVFTMIGVSTEWSFRLAPDLWWIAAPLLLIPITFSIRASAWLHWSSWIAVATLGAVWAGTINTRDGLTLDRVPFFRILLRLLTRFPGFAIAQFDWSQVLAARQNRNTLPLVRGALIALPFLVLFTVLLASADERFADLFSWLEHLRVDELVSDVLIIGISLLAGGSLLLGAAMPLTQAGIRQPSEPRFKLGSTECSVILGLCSGLFGVFVVVQLSYLFGVTSASSSEMTLAEYARSGFFELATVASVSLALLLSLRRRFSPSNSRDKVRFRLMSAINASLVLALLLSAAVRMSHYAGSFGWTELRLYTSASMIWIGVVFLVIVVNTMRAADLSVVKSGLVSAYVLLAALVIINPDAYIAKHNITRDGGNGVDTWHLSRLSKDALPTILNNWDKLSAAEQEQVAYNWHYYYSPDGDRSRDWRDWNRSRDRAAASMAAHRPTLSRLRETYEERIRVQTQENIDTVPPVSMQSGDPQSDNGG